MYRIKNCETVSTPSRKAGARCGTILRVLSVAAQLVAAPALLVLVSGCGIRQDHAAQPRIVPLSQTLKTGSKGTITIRATVLDATTYTPVQLAHVTYDRRVVSTDANGTFSFPNVQPNQMLAVVAAGYRRYTANWSLTGQPILLTPLVVHGLYVPLAGLDDPLVMATIDADTHNTEINTIVLEVKTDDGQVSSQMATPAAIDDDAVVHGYDVKGFIEEMHQRNIYVIGRFVVFRDPTLANAHPEFALKRTDNGQAYEDEQGQKWIDAFDQEVWLYNLDLADKAAQLGLDEIQFDYVRFPGTDLDLNYAENMTRANRVAAVTGFLKQAEERLRPDGVAISADTFGLTTVATDDTGIGQDITSMGPYLDYYCPMVYPSTWDDGSLGIPYPPADPYAIVHGSVQSAVLRLAPIPTVRVRPWLQAFDDYGTRQLVYTPARVNIQKTAAADAGAIGWMLWDPTAGYDAGVIGPNPATPLPAR